MSRRAVWGLGVLAVLLVMVLEPVAQLAGRLVPQAQDWAPWPLPPELARGAGLLLAVPGGILFLRAWWSGEASSRGLLPLALVQVLMLASTRWSLDPDLTWSHGRDLAVAGVLGLFLGRCLCGRDRRDLLTLGLTLATLAGAVVSLAAPEVGRMHDLYYPGAWRGLWSHKNLFGFVTAAAWTAVLGTWTQRRTRTSLVLLAVIAPVLGSTMSASSLVTLAWVSVVWLAARAALRGPGGFPSPRRWRLLLLGMAAVALLAWALVGGILLESLGRTETVLVGRFRLWRCLGQALAARPLEGFGFRALFSDPQHWKPRLQREAWGAAHAHDDALELAVGCGLPCALLYLVALLLALDEVPGLVAAGHQDRAVWRLLLVLGLFLPLGSIDILVAGDRPLFWMLLVASLAEAGDTGPPALGGPEGSASHLPGPARVALVMPRVAPYRVPFLRALAGLPGFSFHLLLDELAPCPGGEVPPEVAALPLPATVLSGGIALSTRRYADGEERLLWLRGGYQAALRELAPEVVVSMEFGWRSLMAAFFCWRRRVPLVLWWEGTPRSERRAGWLRRLLRRLLSRLSRRILTFGPESERYLLDLGIPPHELVPLTPSVDADRIGGAARPTRARRPLARAELAARGVVLMTVGRLIPAKGIREYLAALTALQARRPDLEFTAVFLGDGPLRGEVEATPEPLRSRLRVLGWCPPAEVPTHLGTADVLVFPTLGDVWGMAVLEALAAGVPVLASRHSGIATALLQNPGCGQVFDPEDPEDFVRHLEAALEGGLAGRGGLDPGAARELLMRCSPERACRPVESMLQALVPRQAHPSDGEAVAAPVPPARVAPGDRVRVAAILAFRDEEAYLAHTLRNLRDQDVAFALLDNGSEDGSRQVALRPEFDTHRIRVEDLPYLGYFSLEQQLEAKARVATSLEVDWVLHLDADEVPHPYAPEETLRDAISRIDRAGYTAIDFDEFVFLPLEDEYVPGGRGPQPMRTYYFHQPTTPRLMRAWKRSAGLSNVASGGHLLQGGDLRLCPERLALRHYIFRNQVHAREKYATRRFSPAEIERGWHRNRVAHPPLRFHFPLAHELHSLPTPADRDLTRVHPRRLQYWEW